MRDRNSISPLQLITFIVSSQVGLGIWLLAANVAKSAGHDGWLSVIAGGMVMTLFSVVIMLLLKRYRNQNILEINRHMLGRFIGTTLNVFFQIYLIVFAAFELRGFTEIVHILFLPLTPPLILSCILITPTLYLTWHGLNAVCKFSQIIFAFIFLVILLAFLFHSTLRFTFLLPIGAAGLSKMAKATILTTFTFLGPELIPIIYPHIRDTRPVVKYAIYGILITTFFYTSVCLISTAIFGETMLANLKVSLFNLPGIRPLGFIQRLNFIFIILWFPFIESALRIYCFNTYHTLNNLFQLKRNGWYFFGLFALIVGLSQIPRDLNQLIEVSNYLSCSGIGFITIFMVFYPLSFFNKHGIPQQNP